MMQHQLAPKQKSNRNANSLVKVVASIDLGKWCSPVAAATFEIDGTPAFPAIEFEIDTALAGPYKWSWAMTWNAKVSGVSERAARGASVRTFSKTGMFQSDKKLWVANLGQLLGGVLVVEVNAGTERFRRSVTIRAVNPTKGDVANYLAAAPDILGFDEIVEAESRCKNFIGADGQPIVAFDKGFGMVQLTHPAPTYEQCWNWKANIDAGIALYRTKQLEARKYLGQAHRAYTPDQLKMEARSRWNGGQYHIWDEKAKVWIRDNDLLCDTATSNIGWRLSETDNVSRTRESLHQRDADSYRNPKKDKGDGNKWVYSGVCYAEHLDAQ